MAREGHGQIIPQKINGAGFAVVVAEDAGDALPIWRERVIDAGDLIDLLLPAEAVGVELREGAAACVLGVTVETVEVRRFRVIEPLRRRHQWNRERQDEDG